MGGLGRRLLHGRIGKFLPLPQRGAQSSSWLNLVPLSAVKVGAPSFLKTNDWKQEMGNTGDLGIRTHLTVEPETPGGKGATQGLSLSGDADETPVRVR